MIKIHEVEQGSDEWQKLRAGKYTGSNAAKLLKYGAIDYSLTSDSSFNGNFFTKRGHILEDEAIELYESIRKVSVNRVGFITNSKFPDCGYSPDGMANEVLIEVKCFNQNKHMQLFEGDIPLEVLAQIHFGLMITQLKLAHLVIYNPELDPKKAFKIIEVKANRNIQSNFKKILTPKKEAVTI